MKTIIKKLLTRSRIPSQHKQELTRIGETVERWVGKKGFVKPLDTIEEIASDIGLPANQLNCYLRIRTGKTILTWRKELRIREACTLLLAYPDLPVSTIGEMVGIDDKSNFKRQFIEMIGEPPRIWREKRLK